MPKIELDYGVGDKVWVIRATSDYSRCPDCGGDGFRTCAECVICAYHQEHGALYDSQCPTCRGTGACSTLQLYVERLTIDSVFIGPVLHGAEPRGLQISYRGRATNPVNTDLIFPTRAQAKRMLEQLVERGPYTTVSEIIAMVIKLRNA